MTRTEATDRLLREFPDCEVVDLETTTDVTFCLCKVRVSSSTAEATIHDQNGQCLWWTLYPIGHLEELIGWLKEKVDA